MTFCYSVVKSLLCILNVIFTLLGVAIAALGILCLVCKDNLAIEFPSSVFIGIIVVGIVIFFVGLSGCLGATSGSNCLLITCSVFLLLLAVVKIALIIVIFSQKSSVKDALVTELAGVPDGNLSKDKISPEFHLFELMGQCCGTNGPASYLNGTALPNSNAKVPSSCCPVGFSKPEPMCDYDSAYKIGCKDKTAIDNAMGFLNTVAYSAIGIAILEITALFSAIYLTCLHKSSDGYYEYD